MRSNYNVVPALVVALVAGVLVGCGGGGGGTKTGGSSNPPPNPPSSPPANPPTNPPANPPANPPTSPPSNPPATPTPTLVLSTTTLDAEAWLTDHAGPLKLVQVSLPNQGSTPVHIGGFYTVNGLEYVDMGNGGPLDSLRVVPRRPHELRPGTYTDTITVRACLEWPCVNHISGSPQTISVTYTVRMPTDLPRMTLPQDSLSLQGQVLDPGTLPDQLLDVVINAGESTTWVQPTLSSTNRAIARATFRSGSVAGGFGGQVVIEMKAPATLGVGTFTDTVTVRACLDAKCVNELAGSPAAISVQYTVSDSVPGPNGYRSRTVAVNANDIVWDERRQVFYLSIASASATNANTIGVLDPVSATFQSHAPVGSNPGRLELSPDGEYLYVALRGTGAIQRLVLPSLAVDLTIPLGTRFDGAQFTARELHVSPGSSRTIGVVRSGPDNPWDLAIFDDSTMRPQTAGGSSGPKASTFQWDTATRLFGVDSYSTSGAAVQITVDENGARTTASQEGVTSFDGAAQLANGRIYMERGRIFDPVTFAQIGFLPLATGSTNAGMAVDVPNDRVFLVSGADLKSFALTSFAPIASTWLPRASPNVGTTRMVRWGPNGLAILNYEDSFFGTRSLLLIDGTFVKP